MPTREQERKALTQIKKILDTLGGNPENSYVLRAFDGCVKDAEENIENDFACSWKGRAESAEKRARDWQEKYEAEKKTNKPMQDQVKGLNSQCLFYKKELAERTAKTFEPQQKVAEQDSRIKALEDEIIHLKAKLYDMIVAQQ